MKSIRSAFKAACAWGLAGALCVPFPALALPPVQRLPPTGDSRVAPLEIPSAKEPRMSRRDLVALLRRRVKYVFVLYQENRSFDSYFGTFPGVDGLYSQAKDRTPGFSQPVKSTDGKLERVEPFRVGPRDYAADLDDVGHAHYLLDQKMHVVGGKPRMDHFALAEEMKHVKGALPTLAEEQFGLLTMAHVDGDTIPFLWRWADRFVIFDHIFQLMVGPSTPGNLSIIAAQSGQTQAALHPSELEKDYGKKGPGEPVFNDSDPYWGSPKDTGPGPKMPVNPRDFRKKGKPVEYNQTYATLPLSLARSEAADQTEADPDKDDLEDLGDDLSFLSRRGGSAIPWGWFQEGFGQPLPAGEDPTDAEGVHFSYITHHNGPQYFGYIAHSPAMAGSLHDLRDFFTAVRQGTLSGEGGVYYVKGGYRNIFGLKPGDPDPAVQGKFLGDDDHPADSDSQISEALLAHAVNAIAKSRYWDRCAILITWDDSGGFYDHVPPPIHALGPNHEIISDGPRVPFLLISPYARVHTVVHETGDHGSVVKFADAVFALTPLARLPDELKGRRIGKEKWGQDNWGPDDALTPGVSDLMSAFDPARLAGDAPPLPPGYAEIPDSVVDALPQVSGYGLKDIGITPVDLARKLPNPVPADFNPRPETDPGSAK